MESINKTDINKVFKTTSSSVKPINSNISKSCLLESEESLGILSNLIDDNEYFNETNAFLDYHSKNLEILDFISNSSNCENTIPKNSNPNSSSYFDNSSETDFEFLCTSTPKAVVKSNTSRKSTEFSFPEIDILMNDKATVPILQQSVPKHFSGFKHQIGVKDCDKSSDFLNKTRTICPSKINTLLLPDYFKSSENNIDSNSCSKAMKDFHIGSKVLDTTYNTHTNKIHNMHCDAHNSDTTNSANSDSLNNSTKVSTGNSSTEKTFIVNVSIPIEISSSLFSKCSTEERCNINTTFSKDPIENCTTMQNECNENTVKDTIHEELPPTIKIKPNETFCIDENKNTVMKDMTIKPQSTKVQNKISTNFNQEGKLKMIVHSNVNKCKETVSSKDVRSKPPGSNAPNIVDKNKYMSSNRLNFKAVSSKINTLVFKTASSKCKKQQNDVKEIKNSVIATNPLRRSLKIPKRLEACGTKKQDPLHCKGRRKSISSTLDLKSTISNTRVSDSSQTECAKTFIEKRAFAPSNGHPKKRTDDPANKEISSALKATSKNTRTAISSSNSRQSFKKPELKETQHSVVGKTSVNKGSKCLNPKISARLPDKSERHLQESRNNKIKVNATTNIGNKDQFGSGQKSFDTFNKTENVSSSSSIKVLPKRPQGSLKKPASYLKN